MKLPRRGFLRLAAGAAALPAMPRTARAQSYPSRPVRILVGFPAGGSFDIVARLIGQWLSERLQQPFIIENRPGAGGNIATEAVVRAGSDGHTLLLVGPPNVINATLYEKLSHDFIRDIAPIATVVRVPNVMVVSPSFPAKTVPEFINHAKANRGKLSMASAGIGTAAHLAGELFKMMTGTEMVHIPYRGAPQAEADVVGGQVEVLFDPLPLPVELIKTGKLRALGVTAATRSPVLPDVPPLSDFVPRYEASFWYGLGVPRSTPINIIEVLNREINAGLSDPKVRERLAYLGGTIQASSPNRFREIIADETEKWGKVIRAAGIKAE